MTPFNLSGSISLLSSGVIVVERRDSIGYNLDGIAAEDSYSPAFNCRASVQPIGEDLSKLPEGEDYTGAVNIWAARELKVTDRVLHLGAVYRVITVRIWTQLGGYSDAVAVRVPVGEL